MDACSGHDGRRSQRRAVAEGGRRRDRDGRERGHLGHRGRGRRHGAARLVRVRRRGRAVRPRRLRQPQEGHLLPAARGVLRRVLAHHDECLVWAAADPFFVSHDHYLVRS